MSINTTATANAILNQVAVEVGLDPINDPMGSQDRNFIRMKYLLNTAGKELGWFHNWQFLNKESVIDTSFDAGGKYHFPDDFLYIENQTVWDRSNSYSVYWLSAQDWQALKGKQLADNTIYAKYRIQDGMFNLYPQPIGNNLIIAYEYISKNWVKSGVARNTNKDHVTDGSDTPLYDRSLISRYLKVKWMESVGKDTTKAQQDFNQLFEILTGKDKGSPVLSVSGCRFTPAFLDARRNAPDTGYGK